VLATLPSVVEGVQRGCGEEVVSGADNREVEQVGRVDQEVGPSHGEGSDTEHRIDTSHHWRTFDTPHSTDHHSALHRIEEGRTSTVVQS
jgi:hypothetical protein